ncbi:transmembrane protein, putative [Medicago truncatula]|uniref:Transmembrane protein, putative n=1 Tax=Medicago truncatula TaxID=3880 RepID=A0A072U244_MEDTR|nr:transmembrane protein, putative [Medicago truncatula]
MWLSFLWDYVVILLSAQKDFAWTTKEENDVQKCCDKQYERLTNKTNEEMLIEKKNAEVYKLLIILTTRSLIYVVAYVRIWDFPLLQTYGM